MEMESETTTMAAASKTKAQKKVESSPVAEKVAPLRQDQGDQAEASVCYERSYEDCNTVHSYYKTQNFVLPSHADSVLDGMDALWKQNTLCDVKVTVDTQTFQCHKLLLASCSELFFDLFTEGKVADENTTLDGDNITIKGISTTIAEMLFESMYTGRVPMNESIVKDLLAGATQLKFYAVEEACAKFLCTYLNVSNCLSMLNLAHKYKLVDLLNDATKLAAQNFMDISYGYEYYRLDVELLVSLLKRDDLNSDTELQVFLRVLAWIDQNHEARLCHAAILMSNIRLALLSMTDIVDNVETVSYLMAIPECQKLVQEALHYHCLPARQSILQSNRTYPRCAGKRDVVLAIGGAPRLKNEKVNTAISYFDAEENQWKHLTDMIVPRHHHAAATLGGFLYIVGGEETNDQRSPVQTCFRYDPRKNTWLQLASMNYRRESFQLGVLNGMLYAIGGRIDEDNSLREVERYNPAVDKWDLVAPLSVARRNVAVAAYSGRLYAIGGSGHKRVSSRVERYNPLINQWETRKSLATPRFFAFLKPVDSGLILFGGATLDKDGNVICVKTVERYKPSTDTWTTVTPMLQPRAEAGATVLGNDIYVCGGYNWDTNQRLNTAEVYDSERDCWAEITPLECAYTGMAMASLTIYDTTSRSSSEAECPKGAHPSATETFNRYNRTLQKANSIN